MKNQKEISRIKLIFIIIVIIVLILCISEILDQKRAKENQEYEKAQLKARYEKSYNIGDTISNDQFEITVTNIEERTKVGIPKYYRTVDDFSEILICATIEFKNKTNEPERLYKYRTPDFSWYCKLENEEGRMFHNDSTLTGYYQFEFNYDRMELILNPGETATDVIVFKLNKSDYEKHSFYFNVLQDTALVKIK